MSLTSLIIELLQYLADNLSDTLQRFDIFFSLVKLFLELLYLHPNGLQLCIPFSVLQKLSSDGN